MKDATRNAKRLIASGLGAAALVATAAAAGLDCADMATPVPPITALKPLGEEGYEPLRGFDRALRMGVGHLRPAREEDREHWIRHVLMPLSATPGAPPAAWFAGGWIVPAGGGAPRAAGSSGAIETGYETVSLIVLEIRDGEWLRIRFAPGDEGSSTAWVSRCDLEKLRPRVVYEPWEALLGSSELSPLYFRTGGPRALRRAADPDAELLAWIPAEGSKYALEPLEVQGDWMRVRMKVPSDYCAETRIKPAVREGWIRWRTERLGPLVWYYTRGC